MRRRNCTGDLANDNRDARILEGPRHRFVFLGTIRATRVETEPFSMLAINNAAINWRAIRMDVEDRQKNSDTACSAF